MQTLDIARMRAALALARRGLGATWPNPSVGCIIGREGLVLGRGCTSPGGRPHAEQVALAQARERYGAEALRGATAWVTLEPCAHHGKTPPCAGALAAAGIARVVSTFEDPDPRVQGRGFAALREGGVSVATGICAEEAAGTLAGFLSRIERGRPHLTLKLAASLDGRIATASGESRWITAPPARARAHLMRAESDAVLVGGGTAQADDPALDVRLPGFGDRMPVAIVADGSLALPPTARLARAAAARPLWVLCREGADPARRAALERAGAVVIETPARPDGTLDLSAAMAGLGARGLTRVLCEGGGRLAGALLRAGLADELAWFSAGLCLGADGRPSVGAPVPPLPALADAPRLTLLSVETLGPDVLTRWRPAGALAAPGRAD